MLIMLNANSLIDDFKNQTKTTVWKHLNALAEDNAVYSTHLNGLPPFLADYDVYLYCNGTHVVVVCLDCCGHGDENVFDESDSLGALIMAENCEPRISVVWKLAEAVRLTKIHLQPEHPKVAVYGVLLTEAQILNSFELYDMWDAHDVMVIDDLTRLKYRDIRVNRDSEHARMLDRLILEGMKTVDDEAPVEHDGGDEWQDVDDDMNLDEFPEGSVYTSDDTPADTLFPDGEIEQNNNISVKVDILRPVANPREELDKLVGCADIKRRMDELVALTSYNKMMRELFPNGKQHEVSLHSVFLGRPGTGKTTVCKIFGSLLHQAGALTKGHVVVCDRGTFIGTLWGDEERAMKQVLEMARGGVLMIDEAYLLNGKNDSDPGKLVVQLLMNILADEKQRDIAVVLCGYKEPMMKLLDTNPGLQSRFPNKFEFPDFTVDELLDITQRRIRDYNYQFTAQAWEHYRNMLSQAYQVRDPETWGNARFISNQLERIYIRHAARCVRHCPKNKGELLLLTPEDIVPIEMPRQKARIGF